MWVWRGGVVTGPEGVKTVTNEEGTKEELGGAKMHSEVSGVSHKVFQNDIEAIASTRKLLGYLPQNCTQKRTPKLSADWYRELVRTNKLV